MRGYLWKELRHEPVVVASAVFALLLLLGAIVIPWWSDADISAPDLQQRLQSPSWAGGEGGLLGTDQQGRDLFIRIMSGLRTSFLVGALSTVLAATIGTAVGLLSGYFGGLADTLLMRITDVQLAVPGLLLVMLIVKVLGHGARVLIVALGLIAWMLFARTVRAAVLTLRSSELIVATEGLGASIPRILVAHVLPNVMSAVAAIMGMVFAALTLSEASLSFLGYGVQPPTVSLGAILAAGRDYLSTGWWISTFAGAFLMLTVLSTGILGTWLQRVSDPSNLRRA